MIGLVQTGHVRGEGEGPAREGAAPHQDGHQDSKVRHVAIVGLGPEGLGLLERLLADAATAPSSQWVIDVFESHPVPGAGALYEPSQPSYLRTDQVASQISLWDFSRAQLPSWMPPRAQQQQPIVQPQSLLQWASERGYRVAPADHVPRSLVGRYLHDMFCRLCDAVPSNVTLTLTPHQLEGVRRIGRRWILEHRAEPAATRRRPLPLASGPVGQRPYDHVFVTTAESPTADDPQLNRWRSEARRLGHTLIDQIYPIRQRLSLAAVAPRRTVAIRGMGQPAIDTILALTEGRGGLFVAAGGPAGHPRRYLRSWREPSRIHLISPSGGLPSPQPLLAVESGERDGNADVVASLWQRGRDSLNQYVLDSDAPISLWSDLLPMLVDFTVARWQLSRSALATSAKLRQATDQITRRLYGIAAGRRRSAAQRGDGHDVSVEAWRQETQVACGERPLTLRAASALAWRQLSPQWMRMFRDGRMPAEELPAMRRLTDYFAQRAFGPPAESVCRILALIDAGLVDLTFRRSPQVTLDAAGFQLQTAHAAATCRTLIDTTRMAIAGAAAQSLAWPMAADEPFVTPRSVDRGIRGDGGSPRPLHRRQPASSPGSPLPPRSVAS